MPDTDTLDQEQRAPEAHRGGALALAGKRIDVVLNAAAGALRRRGASEEARQISEALEAAGAHARVHVSTPQKVASRVAASAHDPDVDVLIVGGGDGTISTAVNLLSSTDKTLGILPLGTMNLLARELDLPLSLEPALESLISGKATAIDVGVVNDRRFALHAVLGLYPWVIRRRDQEPIRGRLDKILAWFKVAPRALMQAPVVTASLEHDWATTHVRTHLLMIATGPTESGVGPLLRRERLDTGRLHVYHAKRARRSALVKLVAQAAVGPWPMSSEVNEFEARSVTLRSRHRKLPVALDGEVVLLRTPLRFRILPRALKVLMPPDAPHPETPL